MGVTYIGGNVTVPKTPSLLNDNQYPPCSSVHLSFSQATNSYQCKPVKIYNYRFWVNIEVRLMNMFTNPSDRRIESIGRISDCRIRLTANHRRSPHGFRQQMISIVAPSFLALKKCCRLFDDKFPSLYASSEVLHSSTTPNQRLLTPDCALAMYNKIVRQQTKSQKRALSAPPRNAQFSSVHLKCEGKQCLLK